MTKKDYVAIAGVLNKMYSADYGTEIDSTIIEVAERLSDYFESDNPRFDRDRFLRACKYYE